MIKISTPVFSHQHYINGIPTKSLEINLHNNSVNDHYFYFTGIEHNLEDMYLYHYKKGGNIKDSDLFKKLVNDVDLQLNSSIVTKPLKTVQNIYTIDLIHEQLNEKGQDIIDWYFEYVNKNLKDFYLNLTWLQNHKLSLKVNYSIEPNSLEPMSIKLILQYTDKDLNQHHDIIQFMDLMLFKQHTTSTILYNKELNEIPDEWKMTIFNNSNGIYEYIYNDLRKLYEDIIKTRNKIK